MINFLLGSLFKFYAYVFFGLIMEVKFTAISNIIDGKITEEDKKMKGYVPLWMIPVYGLLLTFVFEPVYFYLIYDLNFILRYIIWCITISGFEALSGFLYDKYMNLRPWDYRGTYGSILNGYTKWTLIPLWGIAGLFIEQYVKLINFLTPSAIEYFKGLF